MKRQNMLAMDKPINPRYTLVCASACFFYKELALGG